MYKWPNIPPLPPPPKKKKNPANTLIILYIIYEKGETTKGEYVTGPKPPWVRIP